MRSSDIHLNDRWLEEMNGNAPVQQEDDRQLPSAAAAHRGMDNNPLAEFYTQACVELDAEVSRFGGAYELLHTLHSSTKMAKVTTQTVLKTRSVQTSQVVLMGSSGLKKRGLQLCYV